MRKLNIYIASKVRYAPTWRRIRDNKEWGDIHFTSRWLDEQQLGREHLLNANELGEVWLRNIEDVKHSDLLIVFAHASTESSETLRGALIEAGVALAFDIPVIACGERVGEAHDNAFGSWQFHPRVTRVANVENIPAVIKKLELVIAG